MEERPKDTDRPFTDSQRILYDLRNIQSELELVRVHCIELEKVVMLQIEDYKNH